MGAGASIEADEAKQREQCDELFTKIDKMANGQLNYMELKKGFEELEKDSGLTMTLEMKEFLKQADTNNDKLVSKDEFYAMMQKIVEDGKLESNAATKIQAVSRGKKDRAKVEEKKEQIGAASKIQAIQRGKQDRKVVEEKKEQIGAATKIQAIQRGKLARAAGKGGADGADNDSRVKALFEALDIKENGALDLEELKIFLGDEAAEVIKEMDNIQTDSKIQMEEWVSFFKKLEKSNPDVVATHLTQLETLVIDKSQEKEAAVKIQAMQRGKQDRKVVEEKKEQIGAATKIQAIQRGKQDRVMVEEKKGSEGGADAAAAEPAAESAAEPAA